MKIEEPIRTTPNDAPPADIRMTSGKNLYDDGNIPQVDLPQPGSDRSCDYESVEPLPESSRPRKDGPGGA